MNQKEFDVILKNRQNQLLKLVTKSFFKELVNYGIDSSDIVTVSMNLLDHVTKKEKKSNNENGYYHHLFTLKSVKNFWDTTNTLTIEKVSISPLTPGDIPQIVQWLQNNEITHTFIDFLPKSQSALDTYFFGDPLRAYFEIHFENEFVGIIGAENIDEPCKKLEMKKFVGAPGFSGKGIGKRATFLFLYHSFMIREFNKVYIHSMDTNIRNININSKFGFELEGVFFQEACKNERFYDVVRMGLLRRQWLKIFDAETIK